MTRRAVSPRRNAAARSAGGGPPLAVGLLALCGLGPIMVLPILGGAIADAVERLRLLRIVYAILPPGSLVSVPFSIVSGGMACVAGVCVLALLAPEFHRFDARAPAAGDESWPSGDPPRDL